MAFRLTVAIAMLHMAAALPAHTLEDLEMVDDTMSVGSYVRETRAAPPENFHKSYQSDGDGEIGYSRKKEGGGKKGYQHFDSFHKKAGDNFEFEKQDSYGLDEGGKNGGSGHGHSSKDSYDDDDGAYSHNHERKAERYREPESEDIDEDHPRRPAKEQKERHHEELKEGASDGNGGVEAYGHNPDDYTLPEKYTYGQGEEYNF